MSTTRNVHQTDVICGLKAAVKELECRHNAQLLEEQKEKVGCKVTLPDVYIAIPIQDIARAGKEKLRSKTTCDTRVSSKKVDSPLAGIRSREEEKIDRCEKTSGVIFPEMRGGILYSRCWCLHRDGLQDYCPLSQCQGQSECLVKPWAVCPPGKLVRLRYPELYPKASSTNCFT